MRSVHLEKDRSLLPHVVLDKMPWIECILMLETLEVVDLVAERLQMAAAQGHVV